ncbi:MAG: gamma-glutamyl-phosphate reductase, partial [Spirochaetia bacterium]|nr:gamma-glutamyl-phosphate reductase [Spirochaetia bacterium]
MADEELLTRSLEYAERAQKIGSDARIAFREIRRSSTALRNQALKNVAEALVHPENIIKILKANEKDLKAARAAEMSPAMQDRLTLDEKRIHGIAGAVMEIAAFPDPVGEIISGGVLVNGIE